MPEQGSPAPEVTYYANGKVKYRGAHIDGEMHGPWEFFRTDGSLMRTGSLERGRQVGTWQTFDRGGRVVKKRVRMSVAGGDRWASGAAYNGYIGRWSRLVAPEFIDWLAPAAGLRWLDVGCGTGILTRTILDHSDPASVVGVDPAQPFVDHAREAVPDARVTFRVGSADATGCEDASVDAVVAGLVLNFVPDLGAALAEAQRVVRPGGMVAGYVWDYAAGMQLLRRFFDAAIALDPGMRAHDEGVRFPITHEGRLAAAFGSAGLVDVDQRPIDVPTVFRDFDDLWTPFLRGTGPAPAYVDSLHEPARAALRDRLRASLPEEPDGTIRLTARAWAVRGFRPGA